MSNSVNSLTAMGLQAGMKNSSYIAFSRRNKYKKDNNTNTTTTTTIPTMASFCPLQRCRYFIYSPSNTNTMQTRGG
jgi:hypothetical protein